MTIFGERLREERGLAGLSGRELSIAAGLDPTHVCKFEMGTHVVSRAAKSIVDTLGRGVTLADLLMAGPRLFEVEFAIGVQGGPPLEVEALMLGAVPAPLLGRVEIWPWTGDGSMRIRARASCLPELAALTGATVPGLPGPLPAPTVRPVSPSGELVVLVRAEGSRTARRLVLAQAARVDCCPPVAVAGRGPALWLARLRSVPAACSMALQRLSPESPLGLFVPG